MLGKNCEVAFYFFRQFGFIDSNLFAWAYIREEHMISVLKHPDILLNGELCPIEHGMIKHIPTEFLFMADQMIILQQARKPYKVILMS